MSQHPILGNISPLIPAGESVEAAIAFYEQLGFTTIHTEGEPKRMAIVQRDSAKLFLVKNTDQHLAKNTAFRIQVSGIEQLYAEFQAQGGQIIHPHDPLQTKPWGMKEFSVIDLAGVCITFWEPANE